MNKSFVTIKIDTYHFGIDVDLVREINRNIDISKVSLAPEYITGLMNLRGQIITIIDPGVRLDLGVREITQKSRCVVFKTASELNNKSISISLTETVGILVDSVGDIVSVDSEAIELLPPNLSDIDNKYISGVVKLENNLLLILKMETMLRTN